MKLNDKQLALFKKHIAKWQPRLGLTDWRIMVEWEKEDSSALAITRLNHKSHQVLITLIQDYPDDGFGKFEDYVDELVFHEMLHVALSDITVPAETNTHPSMADTLAAAEHGVIRMFENLVFRVLKCKT